VIYLLDRSFVERVEDPVYEVAAVVENRESPKQLPPEAKCSSSFVSHVTDRPLNK